MIPAKATPCLLAVVCSAPPSHADDKSDFSLTRPTPRGLWRPMSTDRPDSTESPRTVDAGGVQVELSFVEIVRNDRGARTDTISAAPLNLKLGVLNDLDIQFLYDPWIDERVRARGRSRGRGDLTVRAKLNLVGNDTGGFALGVMPFVTLPTAGDAPGAGGVEGGVILPWSLDLADGLSLGMMVEVDVVNSGDGPRAELIHTIVLGAEVVGGVGVFAEYAGLEPLHARAGYAATFNTGLTLALTTVVQVDVGVRIGLNDRADDYAVFSGLSVRF